jgi:anti-sigma B factor antagonist
MKIAERTLGAVTVIDIDGPITLGDGDTDRLGDKVRSLLQQGRKQLIANLARVSYMDSAGLGELVQAYTTVSRQGGSLKLVGVTKRLNDLLVITKLATVFDSYDSEAAAVASFGAPA